MTALERFIAAFILGAILALSAILAAPIPDRVDMEVIRAEAQKRAVERIKNQEVWR